MSALWTTLILVFIAELGDKSQLLALSLGARHRVGPLMVGAVAAFAATNLIAATVGGAISAAVSASVIAYGSGLVFGAFGLWMLRPLVRRREPPPEAATIEDPPTDAPRLPWVRILGIAFFSMFLAEFADKTMLVTATLAARENPVAVWVGATIGITATTFLGVALGRILQGRIAERTLQIGSALLFLVIGISMVISGFQA